METHRFFVYLCPLEDDLFGVESEESLLDEEDEFCLPPVDDSVLLLLLLLLSLPTLPPVDSGLDVVDPDPDDPCPELFGLEGVVGVDGLCPELSGLDGVFGVDGLCPDTSGLEGVDGLEGVLLIGGLTIIIGLPLPGNREGGIAGGA